MIVTSMALMMSVPEKVVPNWRQANSQLKLCILQKCRLQRVVKSFKQEVMG